jgi:hypothetical protein
VVCADGERCDPSGGCLLKTLNPTSSPMLDPSVAPSK